MRRPNSREASASFWLAVALLALEVGRGALAPGSDRLPPCAHPSELEANGGHTRRVTCDGARGGAEVRGPARVLFGLGIDPNLADAAALEALPGVGPARAEAIVAGRADGAYRTLADLGRVRGIGPVTLRRAAPWLEFGAGPAVTGAGSLRGDTGTSPEAP
jgi:competence protein ComEA